MLADFLTQRRLLLVLDNCEHLAGGAARLVETLLRAAPGLKVLATSRQTLGVVGEHVLCVPPMRVPTAVRRATARGLSRYESVTLFEQRAAAAQPGFAVTDANAVTVGRLVAALDGIPLAIELAAPWLRVLSLDDVLDRLTDRFALLDAGALGPQPAARTLRDLMDWSHGLCSAQEQLLWARLSVFSGGFDLTGAEAVCSGDGILQASVLALVAGLVDKSVLSRQERAGSAARYRLLETVREYGDSHLPTDEERTRLRRRHRDHYQQLTQSAQDNWIGPDQVTWFDRLRLDHDNLRTALEFCAVEPGEAAETDTRPPLRRPGRPRRTHRGPDTSPVTRGPRGDSRHPRLGPPGDRPGEQAGPRFGDEIWAADAVIWCTGFRPVLSHLAPLGLRAGERGRIATTGTRATAESRIHLLGYGDWTGPASAALIGVGRTARQAVTEIADLVR